jgi:hypothetical protein
MWAFVEENQIKQTVVRLPKQLADGTTRSNVHKKPPAGWHQIVISERPNFDDKTQYLSLAPVELIKGVPTQNWVVNELPEEDVDE